MSGTGTVSQAISLSGLPFRPPLPSLPVVVLALFASAGRTPRPSTQAGAARARAPSLCLATSVFQFFYALGFFKIT